MSQRQAKSYTDEKRINHKGFEEELAGLEDRISGAGEEGVGVSEQSDESSAEVRSSRPDTGRLNDLRREAAEFECDMFQFCHIFKKRRQSHSENSDREKSPKAVNLSPLQPTEISQMMLKKTPTSRKMM